MFFTDHITKLIPYAEVRKGFNGFPLMISETILFTIDFFQKVLEDYIMDKHLIAEMTLEEFGRYIKESNTVIFPVGATEAYGLHLPMGACWLVTYEVAKRVARERNCFVAPAHTLWDFLRI